MPWYTYIGRVTKAGHAAHDIVELDSPYGLPVGVPVFETRREARAAYKRFQKIATRRTEQHWAFVTVIDQTIGYLAEAGDMDATIDHKDALLIVDKDEALAKVIELNLIEPGRWWLESVIDVLEFRRRENTW